MRRYQKERVAFVISCLDNPKWKNEMLVHPNWVIIKRAIAKQEPIPMISMPPVLEENLDKMQELRNWQRSAEIFAIKPPVMVTGVTAA